MTGHPMVEAYLAELETALADADLRERAETLAAVREHIDQALADPDADTSVPTVLERLGPVDVLATAASPAPRIEASSTPAVPVLLAAVGSFALFFLNPLFVVPAAGAVLVTSTILLRRRQLPHRDRTLLRAAAAVSGVALIIVAILSLSLLTAGTAEVPAGS